MIGRTFPFGKGFLGLARYLEHGEAGEHRDRVLWVESRNLPTDDPETAARLMAAHARESVRTQRPVYHLVISFDPGDPVDRESMGRVADAVLRRLGLEEHQVLIVAHNDTAHPHMHLVVNRVHPETHVAWENSWDWPKIETELRVQEVELGLRRVPGNFGRVPGQEPAPALERGDAAFLRWVQERAGPVLERARSWAEVEQGLAGLGLAVRVKGAGLTIHDGRQEVKASEVDRAFSRKHMERRLGRWGAYGIERTLEQERPHLEGGVLAPPDTPITEPEPELAAPPAPEPDPPAGPLADVSGPDLLAWLDRERERLQDAALQLKVREAHAHILAAKDYNDRNQAVGEAEGAAHDARHHLASLEAAAAKAIDDHVALAVALYDTYTDRNIAVDKLVEYGRTHGAEQALRVLHDRPEAFGPLVRTYPVYGLGVHWTTMPAVKKARKVEVSLVKAAIRSAQAAPTIRERVDAKSRVSKADKHVDDLRAARRDLPAPLTSERKAAEILRSALRDGADLSWIEHQLGRLLPPGDRAAADIADNVLRQAFTTPRSRTREREGPSLGGMDI